MTTNESQWIRSRYERAIWYSCLKPNVVRSPVQITMSGRSSFTSEMARSSRFGSKYVPPQWRSERWAIRNGRAAEAIARSLRSRRYRRKVASEGVGTLEEVPAPNPESTKFQAYRGSEPPRFVNGAELECARILDWYGIPWEYEPRSFVLERDAAGRVTSAFTPDFYLPEQDLYIEVTVMKQSLVTRKNRKLREVRRLYPGVNVKLVYRRDIERLAQRYRLRIAS